MKRIITGLILGLFVLFFVFFTSDTLFQIILAGILGYSLFELFKIKGKKNIYIWIIFILVLLNLYLIFPITNSSGRSFFFTALLISVFTDIFALVFLIFAFVGIANSFNIIDGFNALLLGFCFTIYATLYFAGNATGDLHFFMAPVFFALLGIFTLNLFGKIFLGDAGAYLIGTLIATGLIIHQQTNDLSPWFVFLMLIYPVTEVLFSFIRKTFIRGKSALQPDGLHFHMLIYKRVSNKIGFRRVRIRHLIVTLFIVSINLPFMFSANIFSTNSFALKLISFWYILVYALIYFILLPKYIFRQKH